LTQLNEPDQAASREHFSDALDRFATNIADDRVRLDALIDFLGRRPIGAMLLFLALSRMVVP
jgi:hypothetical protein